MSAIAVYKAPRNHGSLMIGSDLFRNLIDCGLTTLTSTGVSNLKGFKMPDDWNFLSPDKMEGLVAAAIVDEITSENYAFYLFDANTNTWKQISRQAAIDHARIPLKAQFVASQLAIQKERRKQWKVYVDTHRDIGIITLFFFHSSNEPKWNMASKYCSKLILLLIFSIQWIVPIVVAISKKREYKCIYHDGLCPNGADLLDRILACSIAVLYFSKLTFLGMQKFVDADRSPLTVTDNGGILQTTVICDRFMYLVYEPGVYLINLWIIFLEPDTISIVFRALAMEFILLVDDQFKEILTKVFPPNVDMYMDLNNENGMSPISRNVHAIFWSLGRLCYLFCICCCFLAAFGIWYLPWCKPSRQDFLQGVCT